MKSHWTNAFAAILLGSTALAGHANAQAQFNNIVIVGDSLSDTGNTIKYTGSIYPPAPYYNGRYSNGPIYADTLGTKLGISGTTTDLAVGGAYTNTLNFTAGAATITGTNLNATLNTLGAPSLEGQVLSLLTAGTKYGPHDMAVVFGGANDAFASLGAVSAQPSLTTTQITNIFTATATNVATNIATEVSQFAAMGMKNIVVPLLPNLGVTPEFNGSPLTAYAATGITQGINYAEVTTMIGLSKQLGVNITVIDTYAVINDMVANPAKYGLGNVTAACYTSPSSCSTPVQYLFWDTVHPTSYVQQIFSQVITSILDAPTTLAAQGQMTQIAAQNTLDGINARIDALHNAALFPDADNGANDGAMGPDKKVGAFVAVNGGQGSRSREYNAVGFNYSQQSVSFGADVRLLPNVVAGVMGDFGQTSATLTGGMGSDSLNTTHFGMYAAGWGDHWFASGGGMMGQDNFGKLHRNTFVANQVASATAGASINAIFLKGGPVFSAGGVSFGPVVGFQNIYAEIDSFSESGTVGMNQTVGAQHVRSTQFQFGAQASTAFNVGGLTLLPGLQAFWNHETAPAQRTVSTRNIIQLVDPTTGLASPISVGSVLTTIGGPARDFARIGATLSARATNWLAVNADIEGTQGSGRGDVAGMLQLRASF